LPPGRLRFYGIADRFLKLELTIDALVASTLGNERFALSGVRVGGAGHAMKQCVGVEPGIHIEQEVGRVERGGYVVELQRKTAEVGLNPYLRMHFNGNFNRHEGGFGETSAVCHHHAKYVPANLFKWSGGHRR